MESDFDYYGILIIVLVIVLTAIIAKFIFNKIIKKTFTKEQPQWFKFTNLCILLPILLYPLIFHTTIFFFDNPSNVGVTYLFFFLVNSYPVYLVLIAYWNSLLFKRSKILACLLPVFFLVMIGYAIYSIFFA